MIGKSLSHYEILELIGRGGMGEVYRARDQRLDREVALKILPPEFASDPERMARFRREARLLASLNHTHIASLHGLEEADGRVFLSMELVEGEDLAERLARGPLDFEEALEYARQFAEGLEAAHERNIVHRDLKPANLKVGPDGNLKILDFGLARAYMGESIEGEELEHSPTITAALTGQGVILGTAAYMSPEQARGRKIDQRTDIWAFGTILFEMLSGRRLFQEDTISDTMAAVLRAEPEWELLPEETPDGVRRLLARCLERDGRRRLRDIGEARVRLERWREDPASMQESMSSGSRLLDAPPPRSLPIAWILCGVAVIMAAVLGWRLANFPEPPPRLMELEITVGEGEQLLQAGNSVLLSPDGDWISWSTDEGIWLREISRREPLLLEGTEGSATKCFSPDGKWLAYAAQGQLLRVSVSGGASIPICELPTPRGIAWVDASSIVFAPTITSGLMHVDLTTGAVSPLTEIDTSRSERSHRWPTAVPGRRAVLFECQFLGQDYDQSDIQMVDLDGGERKTVYRGGAAPLATNRGQLLFMRDHTLFGVWFDPRSGETRGLAVPLRENVVGSVGNQEDDDGSAQYCVDGRGSLLYLDNRGSRREATRLAWFDLATGKIDAFGSPGHQSVFSLSPDGRKLVVARTRDGDENLYVHDLATGTENTLTYRPSIEYVGAWSPDSRVFYWSQSADSGDRFEIWRRPVDGSAPPSFVAASPTQAGIWAQDISPDGRYLACAAWMGSNLRDILILDLENPDAGFEPFAASNKNHEEFGWIAPGLVLYREGRGEGGTILIRRFPDDGAVWSLPDPDAGGYWSAEMASTGDAILLDGPEASYRCPIQIEDNSVRVGSLETLHVYTLEERRRLSWRWLMPDGKRVLCFYADDPSGGRVDPQLVLVTGWLGEAQARIERGR